MSVRPGPEKPSAAGGTSDDGQITFDQFAAVDMRVGRIVQVEDFPEARRPAWKLRIDFGPQIGIKRSSAQITNYGREQLEGRLVIGVVNFPPRQIGPVRSEVLVLGTYSDEGVLLLAPEETAALGDRVG
jgi:tRNA-binding protein